VPDRVFDFDPGVALPDAVRTIRAALEDEGLTLAPEHSHGRITSVVVSGRCLVRVPESRIVSPEQDEEIRALIERGGPDMAAALQKILRGVSR
jgi:hypothetical protein